MTNAKVESIEAFIARWQSSGGAERANYGLFLSELCDLLGVDRPQPADAAADSPYRLEYPVIFDDPGGGQSTGRIDLYKRDCFVLEAKQGTDRRAAEQFPLFGGSPGGSARRQGTAIRGTPRYHLAMQRAKAQAERYAKSLPASHGWPPFLVIVDVGHSIELFADFSRSGKNYAQFPDAQRFRIALGDLHDPAIRRRLATVWTAPQTLDPGLKAARVTKEIADHLANLARRLEARGNHPGRVAGFLMRCLFTMFAEDVTLLPKEAFKRLLTEIIAEREPGRFALAMPSLWRAMDLGEYDGWVGQKLLRFNGGLFKDTSAIELELEEIGVLLEAAKRDWSEVEPAIFGTLVERALEPTERHRLGAHFTPRAYVERLVTPTIIEPLREQWRDAQTAALLLAVNGHREAALKEVRGFHRRLCEVKVLDPACGTGNFLYVAMELMKRLEGEVIEAARELGQAQDDLDLEHHTVDPHQFLGIELNPRAAAIAELVLWIGYLQWHFRTRGHVTPAQPVLRNFTNIKAGDALLAWDAHELVPESGRPVTRWDGTTMKRHPVTGETVPDEAAQEAVHRYVNPRPAPWPEADFIVGNPPYQGGKDLRQVMPSGYAEALWAAYPLMPRSADFVMYWWDRAALATAAGKAGRFGFITTNSITQEFNRRVVERHLDGRQPLSILFAIPDHPWVNEKDGAAVRVAMTVAAAGTSAGVLQRSVGETSGQDSVSEVRFDKSEGMIHSKLRIGANIGAARRLLSNDWLCSPGVKLHGKGFILSAAEARHLGYDADRPGQVPIYPYRNGRDLTQSPRGVFVIDCYDLSENELRQKYPQIFQWLAERVKVERDGKANRSSTADAREYAGKWWLFGKTRPELRHYLEGLPRFIATVETAKHRTFQFVQWSTRPDNMLVCMALDDAFHLGVLSSRIHVAWALAAGGRLEDRPRYNKSLCFDPFPFPLADTQAGNEIRNIAEDLDNHRRERQATHPGLTMTGIYNVLEKLRAGGPLDARDRHVHEAGLVSVLKDIHDRLDVAVAAAYGWKNDLSEEEILLRLVALNHERANAERQGQVHWLRRDYQLSRAQRKGVQEEINVISLPVAATISTWPKSLSAKVALLRETVSKAESPASGRDIAKLLKGAKAKEIEELLQMLAALGHARKLEGERYAA